MADADFVFPMDSLRVISRPCVSCGNSVEFRTTATDEQVDQSINQDEMDVWCAGCFVLKGAENIIEAGG